MQHCTAIRKQLTFHSLPTKVESRLFIQLENLEYAAQSCLFSRICSLMIGMHIGQPLTLNKLFKVLAIIKVKDVIICIYIGHTYLLDKPFRDCGQFFHLHLFMYVMVNLLPAVIFNDCETYVARSWLSS